MDKKKRFDELHLKLADRYGLPPDYIWYLRKRLIYDKSTPSDLCKTFNEKITLYLQGIKELTNKVNKYRALCKFINDNSYDTLLDIRDAR